MVLLLPLLALAALAAGCGGSSTKASASTPSTTTAARPGAAARAKFVSCLEAHGVPAGEATRGFGFRRNGTSPGSTAPGVSTPPTTTAAFAAAFAACRNDLPGGFGPGGLRNTAAGRAYLQCLQLHGVTVPTTVPGGGSGGGFGSMGSEPGFQAARQACAALAPARTGDSGGPTTSTTSQAP